MKKGDEFYKNSDKYLSIDDVGAMRLQWFFNDFATKFMIKHMPIFDKAYKLLTERKHFSRKNAFGEMHGDRYLYIEKHKEVQVIISEAQSYKYIYIKDGFSFHIRELSYDSNYPDHRKYRLKGITIDKFRKQGFKPRCTNNFETNFYGFAYGDSRDEGYLLSMNYMKLPGGRLFSDCDYANSHTLSAIRDISFWEYYIDNPEELE